MFENVNDIFGIKKKISNIQIMVLGTVFFMIFITFIFMKKDKIVSEYHKPYAINSYLWVAIFVLILYDTRMTLVGGSIDWSWFRLIYIIVLSIVLFTQFIQF